MEGKIHPCCFLSRHQFFSRIIARSFVDTTREIHRLSISSHLTRNSPHHNRLPTLIIHQVRETGRSLDRPRITCLFNGTTTAVAIDPQGGFQTGDGKKYEATRRSGREEES